MESTSGGATFPLFMSLPAELRQRVWTFFCPDLDAQPLVPQLRPTTTEDVSLDSVLSGTTSVTRTVLAVHQDSRQLALEALPDTLRLQDGETLIRFRGKRDVILLWGYSTDKPSPEGLLVRSLSDTVVNLAMRPHPHHVQRCHLYCVLPKLKILYEISFGDLFGIKDLVDWLSQAVHDVKVGVDGVYLFWPDLSCDRWSNEADSLIVEFPVGDSLIARVLEPKRQLKWVFPGPTEGPGPAHLVAMEQLYDFPTDGQLEHLDGVKVWPMVVTAYRFDCHSREYFHHSGDKEEDGLISRYDETFYCFADWL